MRRFMLISRSLLQMMLRDGTNVFWNFAFPIGLICLYGVIWGDQQFGAVAAITWLTVGVVVLNIMSSGFIGDAAWLTNMREEGILLRVQATPLPAGVLIGAYLLVRLLLILIQSTLIVMVAIMVFGAVFSWSGLISALAWAALGTAVFIAMGQAVAAIAPTGAAAAAIGQVIYFPLMFVSNLFLPSDGLPAWLLAISRWTPAYMLVDLLRPLLVAVPAAQPLWMNGLGLLLYGVLGMVVAATLFRWSPRH